jgi:Grx4 family monothiol glutaredoxin
MVDAAREAMAEAQDALRGGRAHAARAELESAASAAAAAASKAKAAQMNPNAAMSLQGEAHMALAELLWQQGEKLSALQNYEAALELAREQGDSAREGMISLGMGYALLNSGDTDDLPGAMAAMRRSKNLAEAQGHAAQVNFVSALLAQADQRMQELAVSAPVRTAEEEEKAMMQAFVQSLTSRSSLMLFMKGTALQPLCGFSLSASRTLMDLHIDFDSVDVQSDSRLREAIKQFSDWPTFPQLWVQGELFGGSDIIAELDASGELLSEINLKLPPLVGGADSIEGSERVPHKKWEAATSEQSLESACGSGGAGSCHHHGPSAGEGGRWQLSITLSGAGPETASHSRHKGSSLSGRWRVDLTPPVAELGAACSSARRSRCSHTHIALEGRVAKEDGLSEEAREWMAANPGERLPLHLCPTHGDCNTCPERDDCKFHDIEDVGKLLSHGHTHGHSDEGNCIGLQ